MSRAIGATLLTTRSPIRMRPAVTVLESRDHPQRGGLAASGRADEHEELAVGDLELEVVDRASAAAVGLRHMVEGDAGHPGLTSSIGSGSGSAKCAAASAEYASVNVRTGRTPIAPTTFTSRSAPASAHEERPAREREAGLAQHVAEAGLAADDRQRPEVDLPDGEHRRDVDREHGQRQRGRAAVDQNATETRRGRPRLRPGLRARARAANAVSARQDRRRVAARPSAAA